MSKKGKKDESRILYQKLGNIWYLFTEIEGELIFTALPAEMNPFEKKLEIYEIIEKHKAKIPDLAA